MATPADFLPNQRRLGHLHRLLLKNRQNWILHLAFFPAGLVLVGLLALPPVSFAQASQPSAVASSPTAVKSIPARPL
ncbi:MAG: hypothetical protein MUP33_02425, partial [Polaromonas sp.]|nr:hypothetical protein [Polaromonas sp.]